MPNRRIDLPSESFRRNLESFVAELLVEEVVMEGLQPN
jgi:hypothetical protein